MRTSSNAPLWRQDNPDLRPQKHSATFRHASAYLAAAYFSRAICAFRAFINARWLGPEIYGFFGTLSFITSFAYQLHLGTLEVMTKEVPALLHQEKRLEARRLAHITFTFYLTMMLFACAAIWIYALNLPPDTPSYVRIGWLVGSVILGLEVFYDFQQTLARAEQRFRDISLGILAVNVFSVLITFWLVRDYAFYGYLFVAVATPLTGIAILIKSTGETWRLAWSTSKIVSMIRTGSSILAMTLVFKAVWWIDRILVLHYAGAHGFGYYLLGTMAAQICFLLPEVLASVIEPKIHYDYAVSRNPEHLRKHLNLALLSLAYLMPVGLLLSDIFVPIFVKHALPQYGPAIPSIRILIWGSLLMGFSACTKAFMVALGKQTKVLWIYGAAILSNLAAGVFFAEQGGGIEGIAAGTLIGYSVCSLGLLSFAYFSLGDSFLPILQQISALMIPPAAAALLAVALPEYLETQNLSPYTAASIRALGLLAYGFFVAWQIEKKIGFKKIFSWLQKSPNESAISTETAV